jgi:two-component system phosphate regulon sensor histidine kinase PhoR
MASRLGLKLGVGYAVLVATVMVVVGLYLTAAARASVVAELRERLAAECDLVSEIVKAQGTGRFASRARQVEQRIGARITVIAPGGKVLVDSEADPAEMDLHDTRPEVVDALAGGTGWAVRPSLTVNTNMLYVARYYGASEPIVRVAMPLSSVEGLSAGVQRAVVLAALGAGLLCVIGGFVFAGSVTRSLGHLAGVARRLGAGDLTARAHVATSDETAELSDALNGMADRLSAARGQLEEQAAHLGAILGQMADGVLAVGPDETIQVFNAAAGQLLETAPEAALGRRLAEVALNYELVEYVRRAMRLRTMERAEVCAGSDSPRVLAAVVSPVEAEDGGLVGAVLALRDMTELRRLEKVRQDFVANASHELRTPVAAIRSLAETLEGGALSDSEVAPRFLAQIVTNTEALARLLDDMMSLARLEATQYRPEPRSTEVAAAVQAAVSRLEPQASAKGIQLSMDVPEDLTVWCAEEDLLAAVVNLIDNAVKYTPEGGAVSVEGWPKGDRVLLSVTDTGPGIPESERSRIFERFYRVDKGRSRALGGTGLGLSIVKHAIESSGGRVWVESAPDGGARFTVNLSAGPSPSTAP